jgi:hypothetical protein
MPQALPNPVRGQTVAVQRFAGLELQIEVIDVGAKVVPHPNVGETLQ